MINVNHWKIKYRIIAVQKQRRFLVDNLMLGVQLADNNISTRSSAHAL